MNESPNINNPLETMQADEKVLCEIRRHPIGMLGMYGVAGVLLIVVAVVAFGIAPQVFTNADNKQVLAAGSLAFLIIAVLTVIFLLISHYVYWNNRWIVTSDSITQINQKSLFSRQSSQLSLANLEDITAEQNGLLAHMFNYGVIWGETAGERDKFVFTFCPKPNEYAKTILDAREKFEEAHHGGKQQPFYTAPPTPPPTGPAAPTAVDSYDIPDGQ